MRSAITPVDTITTVLTCWAAIICAQDKPKPYRLTGVDLKQRVIWTSACRQPEGQGLAFGGQDQDAADGRPHTRIMANGAWRPIHESLREKNPLQDLHAQTWALRMQAKNLRARMRHIYFKGAPPIEAAALLKRQMLPALTELRQQLGALQLQLGRTAGGVYVAGQARFAHMHVDKAKALLPDLQQSLTPSTIQRFRVAQIHLELGAEALDAEPPARVLHCGKPHRRDDASPDAVGIVYDAKTKLYVMFGGDHLDYLTNDTWVFEPARQQWRQRHPPTAPPPRANHRLEGAGDGKIRMAGGYTYASNTDYVGGQFQDLADGEWVYDVEANTWRGNGLVAPDSRVWRDGPFHPDFYLQGDRPDAAKFQAWLAEIPKNRWVATDPPYRPRLNRDWGTARIDPDRDMLLRWSGGHSAHGGTDVPHFHFATNRWELPFPVEFPLGQLYSNTSYPNGFNFNLRPWMTGHTYQNYAYDPPSQKLVKAGRPRHFYVYDPDVGDWIGRGAKPQAMQYNSCFYTLTLCSTPQGIICWNKQGGVHRYDHAGAIWRPMKLAGDKLPGAVVDNSTIAYDSKRNRVLMLQKPYGKAPYTGQIYAMDLESNTVTALSPDGMAQGASFAYIDRCTYDPHNDLLLLASYINDAGDHTPTPAYDCAANRWRLLDIGYDLGKRGSRTIRVFPHGRSDGIMYDRQRRLIWGTDTNSQVYVLRLAPE